MTQSRDERKEFLRQEMLRDMEVGMEAARRQVGGAAKSGAHPLRVFEIAGRMMHQSLAERLELQEGDEELMQEIAREEHAHRLRSSIAGLTEAANEISAHWGPMTQQLERDRQGPVNIQPGDICALPGVIDKERDALKSTALYVVDRDGDTLVVCPLHVDITVHGIKTKRDYDVVLVGKDSPLSAFPTSKTAVRPWLTRRIPASAITNHPAARLYEEQHQRVVEAYEFKSSRRKRPWAKPAWDAAWRSVIQRLVSNN